MQLAYGNGYIEIDVPKNALVVEGRDLQPLTAPHEAVTEALRRPIAGAPLAELVDFDSSVVILVSDSTRPTGADIFIPALLQELENCGVQDHNIVFIVATGAHRPLTEAELKAIVPAGLDKRYRVLSHDCHDSELLSYVGTTGRGNEVRLHKLAVAADLRILTGALSIHPFAGFGGGRKALFPGVAAYETICFNHSLMLHPQAAPAVLTGNPVHEDFMEGLAFVGPMFLLNSIVTEKGAIAALVAGQVNQAHLQGAQQVLEQAQVAVPHRFDTVIVGAGGFPYDINLYQAVKALQNAARIVRRGGDIILVAECSEGVGSDSFSYWGPRRLSSSRLAEQLKEQFVLGKHKCYFVSEILERSQVYLYSGLDQDLVASFGFIPLSDLASLPLGEKVALLPRGTATLPVV